MTEKMLWHDDDDVSLPKEPKVLTKFWILTRIKYCILTLEG